MKRSSTTSISDASFASHHHAQDKVPNTEFFYVLASTQSAGKLPQHHHHQSRKAQPRWAESCLPYARMTAIRTSPSSSSTENSVTASTQSEESAKTPFKDSLKLSLKDFIYISTESWESLASDTGFQTCWRVHLIMIQRSLSLWHSWKSAGPCFIALGVFSKREVLALPSFESCAARQGTIPTTART